MAGVRPRRPRNLGGSMMTWTDFLDRPGAAGPFGALMDEYARAADDFCRSIEGLAVERFSEERPSDDPDTRSIAAVCAHTVASAYGYGNYIRQARGVPASSPQRPEPREIASAGGVRSRLEAALRYTEASIGGLYDADAAVIESLRFQVRWGPTYDPEMILEHAIVHLLRHRRQIERWPA